MPSHRLALRFLPTSRSFTTSLRSRHEAPPGLPPAGSIPRMQRGLPEKRRLPDVTHTILVTSAKGGVGKSTLATNLSLSLSRLFPLRVGLLDADVFGPSIPTLLGLSTSDAPRLNARSQLLPLQAHGVKTMSMGFLVGEKAPVAWRGLMVMKAVQQLLLDVDWGGLDVLVVDMPPGTGDVQLSVAQLVELDGAVVVSTPQDVALKDAVRGVEMWRKMQVPVLGLVQNMSVFVCEGCGKEEWVFGREGVRKEADRLGVELLGDVPLKREICGDSDEGVPTVAKGGEAAEWYGRIAKRVWKKLKEGRGQ